MQSLAFKHFLNVFQTWSGSGC